MRPTATNPNASFTHTATCVEKFHNDCTIFTCLPLSEHRCLRRGGAIFVESATDTIPRTGRKTKEDLSRDWHIFHHQGEGPFDSETNREDNYPIQLYLISAIAFRTIILPPQGWCRCCSSLRSHRRTYVTSKMYRGGPSKASPNRRAAPAQYTQVANRLARMPNMKRAPSDHRIEPRTEI